MKKALSLTLLLAAFSVFANVGVFRGSGQTVVLDSTAQIQMVEEVVTMTPMRGNYPIDDSCRNMDPMKYHCVFKLRNLTDQTVTVPVGFPISTETLRFQDKAKINQSGVIASFGFVAGTREKTYSIRYVPFDRKKKFSNIFLWDMTFQPKQEVELFVGYTMYGYLGLATTLKGKPDGKYKHHYLSVLEMAAGQGHFYVTQTGKSWAGKIEKATFRIIPFEFEKYLAKRGAFEGERRNSNKEVLLDLLASAPMIRCWSPEYEKWRLVKDNRNSYLELVYAPFEPKTEADDLKFMYVFPAIPTAAEHFDRLMAEIKKNWQNLEPYSPSVERNLADAILEFYGIPRNNPEIKEFLERQCWYPADPRPIDPALKKRLLEVK